MTIVRYRSAQNRHQARVQPFNRLFDQLRQTEETEEQANVNTWRPAVDVTESPEAYIITAELPGISENDLELSVEDNAMTLQGEKKFPEESKANHRFYGERCYGKFQRVIRFPESIDPDKIEANYSTGILTVTLQKTEDSAEKQIPVTFSN